ncbi:hypothetical protein QQF73_09265 [Marinobacter sp. M216]|uniref:Uncharacterized protein n=1 Tax=Marinobacter albus TaxID=3030833 RepID=A0ABT7HD78_9GAMM|nr:hypothetical protein [Marinobacter sp. M216]MDK9557810.1 hypothetical protein [Marinobacter sp. M216]
MTRQRAGLIITAACCLAAPAAFAAQMSFTGTARTYAGETLYLEQHAVAGTCESGVFQPQEHSIAYQRPDRDHAFASKDLNYSDSVLRPAVDFRQPEFDESLSIEYPEPNTLVINWQMPAGESRTFDVPFSEKVVVDAGFDNFVRRNWRAVLNGESVEFRFLGPTRGEHYEFVLESTESSKVTADHVVQIRPTGMVLRFLVDPIILGYNARGALTDYYGLTNIRKNNDANYTAHIQYSVSNWPDCELTP